MLYTKFPRLELAGKTLVWDLRQDLSQVPAQSRRVYVKSYLDASTKAKLNSLAASEYVTDGSPEMMLGMDAAAALDHPSRKLRVLAVTGTNGKSTTVAMLGQLCSHKVLEPVVVLGTLGLQTFQNGVCVDTLHTGFTTPDSPGLQYLLSRCVAAKINYVIMEASSQGWSFGRLAGLELAALGFTNLTQDHLDYHGTMAAYAEAKASIFREALKGTAVLHASDERAGHDFVSAVVRSLEKRARVVDYRKDFTNLISSLKGHAFDFDGRRYHVPLVGLHNLENLRVAFDLFESQFAEYPSLESVAQILPAKGRLELCGQGPRPYVYVDYAHTPDALEKSLQALLDLKTPDQRIWVLFGCGGDRDPSKRPLMGQIATKLADEVVLSSDNPRTEDPLKIMAQIRAGIAVAVRHQDPDRRRAICYALTHMTGSDILLIAGKGHEEYQILGTQKVPFSDFDEVAKAVNQIFTTEKLPGHR